MKTKPCQRLFLAILWLSVSNLSVGQQINIQQAKEWIEKNKKIHQGTILFVHDKGFVVQNEPYRMVTTRLQRIGGGSASTPQYEEELKYGLGDLQIFLVYHPEFGRRADGERIEKHWVYPAGIFKDGGSTYKCYSSTIDGALKKLLHDKKNEAK